jgi:hypothetical protein
MRVAEDFAKYVNGEHEKTGIPIVKITEKIAEIRPIVGKKLL